MKVHSKHQKQQRKNKPYNQNGKNRSYDQNKPRNNSQSYFKNKQKYNNKKSIQTDAKPDSFNNKNMKNVSLQHLPTIQQLLAIPQTQRKNKSIQIFQQVRPFLTSFFQKKQGSRVSQLLFKWGDHSVKTVIYKQIIKSWKDLIKSKYALYVIAKVSKQFQLPGLVEDLALLQNNRQGAQILQNYIHSNPQSQNCKKLKQKIMKIQQGALKGQIKDQQLLDNFAIKSIQKQYYWFTLSKLVLRLRLSTMFQQQKQKAIELLVNNCSSIVNDQQGVRLFIQLMNNCTSKQKKLLVKQYKGYLNQIVKANNISYISVIKLMIETDDTVMIVKSFEDELNLLVPEILQCKKAFSLIFSFFSPRNNNFNILGMYLCYCYYCIGKYEQTGHPTTCKKPEEQRKKQIRQCLYKPIIQFLQNQDNLRKIIQNPIENKLIVGLTKCMQQGIFMIIQFLYIDHHSQYTSFLTYILKFFLSTTKTQINTQQFSSSSLAADINGSKILKSILLLQQDFIQFYCDQFAKLFIDNLQKVLDSKASFILLSILEKGGRDHLITVVYKVNAKFDKCIAAKYFEKLFENVKGETSKSVDKGNKKKN